jgi:hypothetical protein
MSITVKVRNKRIVSVTLTNAGAPSGGIYPPYSRDKISIKSLPERIQLSRKKGWRMPANTIKVDRTTPPGNPFIVGKHGTTKECVDMFRYLCHGLLCKSVDKKCLERQEKFLKYLSENKEKLKGKHLACWCGKKTFAMLIYC